MKKLTDNTKQHNIDKTITHQNRKTFVVSVQGVYIERNGSQSYNGNPEPKNAQQRVIQAQNGKTNQPTHRKAKQVRINTNPQPFCFVWC